MNFTCFNKAQLTCFDEESDKAAADKAAADKAAADKAEANDEKKFSQEDFNRVMAEEKRKTNVHQREMAAELAEIKKNSSLSDEEKQVLEARIDELQTQYLSAEERARQASESTQKKNANTLKELTDERDTWRIKHEGLVIDNAVTAAASNNKALFTEQIADHLVPKTKLVEKLDDSGKQTGIFEARVSFPDTNKEGKSVTLDLTVNQAVKRMRELDQYGNLFEGDKTGGLGQSGSAGKTKGANLEKLAKSNDAEAYRKARKKPQ